MLRWLILGLLCCVASGVKEQHIAAILLRRRLAAVALFSKKHRQQRARSTERARMDFYERTHELNDAQFRRMFRVSRELFEVILEEIGEALETQDKKQAERSSGRHVPAARP